MNHLLKASLIAVTATIVSGGIVLGQGEPEEIKTARWIGVEEGKLECKAMKQTQKYDRESLDAYLKLYGGPTYKYIKETYSRWYREEKRSLTSVAIEAQHNYMRANCLKEFDKSMEALAEYLGLPLIRKLDVVPVTLPPRPDRR
jgi:hypothetical protein